MKTMSINKYVATMPQWKVKDVKFFSKPVAKVTALSKIRKTSEYKIHPKSADEFLILISNAGHRDEIIGFAFDTL